eukprot:TRINITY_DN935_c0_g2_i13.p1 TRINITY_DN935_c0_g2~~TRINITY_DN935_c0_g2_i13.p1  ORF type:complete len:129 (+),score=38.97 TRINITY_DN935_c0_g2_i13:64-450(+)
MDEKQRLSTATTAVLELQPAELEELESYAAGRTPPPRVVIVIQAAVLLQTGKKEAPWTDCQGAMADPKKFLTDCGAVNADAVPAQTCKDLNDLYFRSGDLDLSAAMRTSTLAGVLCEWLHAVHGCLYE